VLAILIAGLCGYFVGKLSFSGFAAPIFVIVNDFPFAEVVRLVCAPIWVELTQGPLALTNISSITIGLPGLGSLAPAHPNCRNYYPRASLSRWRAYVPDLGASFIHSSHFSGRAMRGLMEKRNRWAVSVGHRTSPKNASL